MFTPVFFNRIRSHVLLATVPLTLVVLSAGCQSSQKETAPVRGTVTLDGKPLTTGTVTFAPKAGRSATGVIEPDGSFTLTTYSPSDGAIVGHHQISIQSYRRRNGRQASESGDDEESEFESLIPLRYCSRGQSGLTFEVRPGEDNVADLKLESK